ncbi:MAG: cysteine peptidase family C39 domain-containing protein [Geminicoccaceae bacterium]
MAFPPARPGRRRAQAGPAADPPRQNVKAKQERVVDGGLVCLWMLLRYLKQPADLAQLAHEFGGDGRPLTRGDLVRIASQSGLKARATRLKLQKLNQESLPVLAEDRDGGFFVLAKLNDSHALI